MHITIAEKILEYPKQAEEYRQKFLKRNSIEDFKKIQDSQIELEFKVTSPSSRS